MEQNKYVIEKGVPVARANAAEKYPFNDMEVGDSFLVPKDKGNHVRNAASKHGTYGGKKFITRARNEKDHGESGMRVWRIK